MTAAPAASFAARALDRFPALLVEMIRAGAMPQQIRDEGFTRDEITAAQELIFQVDAHERLDGRTAAHAASESATGEDYRQDATAKPVTVPH